MQDTCKKENAKKEKMDDKQWYQQSSDAQKFDPRVIPADAPALCTVRMAQQSFNDHYLGAYRCGLGMEVRNSFGFFFLLFRFCSFDFLFKLPDLLVVS